MRGFSSGTAISLDGVLAYSLFGPGPASALEPILTKEIEGPAPGLSSVQPGFKPLSDRTKGALVGAAGMICTTAIQSRD